MKIEIDKNLFEKIHEIINEDSSVLHDQINKLNFYISKKIPNFKLMERINTNSRKVEICYLAYILGVVENDKEMRIKAMKKLKLLLKYTIDSARGFKDFWEEIQKETTHKNCKSCDKE